MPADTISRSGEPDFRLGEWWVRPQLNLLERDGEQAHLEPRSMAVLLCLARRAPDVVSKERLLREVWADSPYVGEEVLSHAIWDLRRALEDSAKEPRYVQTIPRKGYRLVMEVSRTIAVFVPAAGVVLEHYELGEELGRGAMGVVRRAVDRRLGRPVAIKFLAPELTRDPDALQRFEREARLAASLDHPNLATVLEIGATPDGQRYLVNPLYQGGTLKERIAKGPLPVDEVIRLGRQLAMGLSAAHRRDIIHRDIKPANLLLDEHGTLKIADFGIAKLLGATDLTRTGATLGTPAYKSPEQSRGESVDHRSDLWSAGVVLFEMATGRRPFDGEYDSAVMNAVLAQEPRALVDVQGRAIPDGLRRIIGKAMAKGPADRYQSADELCGDLEAQDKGGTALPRRPRPRRQHLAIGAAAGAALFVSAWMLWPRGFQPSPPARQDFEKGQEAWLKGNDPANFAAALENLERAAAEPGWAEARALLAVYLTERFAARKQGDPKGAQADRERSLALIAEARRLDPNTPYAWVAESRLELLADKPDFQKAEQLARRSLARESSCSRERSCDLAYVWLGEALWQQKRRKEAFDLLERGAEVGGGRIRCNLKLAQLRALDGDQTEAQAAYENVLEWEPNQTTALNDFGAFLLGLRQYERATVYFERSFKLTADPVAAHNLGEALAYQGLWADSLVSYRKADEIFQATGAMVPVTAVSIGDVLVRAGRPEEARDWYQKALDRFDTMHRGEILGLRGQAQRAVCLAKLERFGEADEAMTGLLPRTEELRDIPMYAARIAALKGDRANLFRFATTALALGTTPHRLLDDVAFRRFEADPEYKRLLVPRESGN